MENPIKIDDLGVPLFLETPISVGQVQKAHQIYKLKIVASWELGWGLLGNLKGITQKNIVDDVLLSGSKFHVFFRNTLQGTDMSHLEKRKIIFKSAVEGDMLVPRRVSIPKILGNTPRKTNECPLSRDYFSTECIFQPWVFRGHVSFQGSRSNLTIF